MLPSGTPGARGGRNATPDQDEGWLTRGATPATRAAHLGCSCRKGRQVLCRCEREESLGEMARTCVRFSLKVLVRCKSAAASRRKVKDARWRNWWLAVARSPRRRTTVDPPAAAPGPAVGRLLGWARGRRCWSVPPARSGPWRGASEPAATACGPGVGLRVQPEAY